MCTRTLDSFSFSIQIYILRINCTYIYDGKLFQQNYFNLNPNIYVRVFLMCKYDREKESSKLAFEIEFLYI